MKKSRNAAATAEAPALPSKRELASHAFTKIVEAFAKAPQERQADKVGAQLVARSFGKRRHVRGWPGL